METFARMMVEAHERVSVGWCQITLSQDEDGRAVWPQSSEARRWSMLGAVLASWEGGPVEDLRQAVTVLRRATEQSPLEVWNDRAERTQKEVIAAFECAIEPFQRRGANALPQRKPLGGLAKHR
jgi:hypothetical protein